MSTIVFDIEVAFYPEITRAAMASQLDERTFGMGKFGPVISANAHYVTNISYKIDDKKVVDLSLLDGKGKLEGDVNEKQILIRFAEVYNSCQESVVHYGAKFDIRFLNARYQKYGLPRLRPIKLQDTWRIMKQHFLLVNNRLDSAIKFFGCPYGKPSLEWEIWRRVSLGDKKAHKILRHRCRYDVLSLAWLWEKVFAQYANRANQALKYEHKILNTLGVTAQVAKAHCPKCGKYGTLKQEGFQPTKTSVNKQLSCRSCFGWSHAPVNAKGLLGRIR